MAIEMWEVRGWKWEKRLLLEESNKASPFSGWWLVISHWINIPNRAIKQAWHR
jgi:hypothetical protein